MTTANDALPFRAKPQDELSRLPDEELIGYLRAAHATGASDAARTALQVLVFGHYGELARFTGNGSRAAWPTSYGGRSTSCLR